MTLQDLAIQYKLTPEEIQMCSNYLVALRIQAKNIPAREVMNVINNWDKVKMAIRKLNFIFRDE